jgi:Outer membrane protein and related peptidoglycan-associated (lipo)proteins
MKKNLFLLVSILCCSLSVFAQADAAGCKDSPMFPERMHNYYISECTSNFDEADFNLTADGSKILHKEGTKTMVRYDFNTESGQQKPSVLQILKNYENAAKNIGGSTIVQSAGGAIATYKIMKQGKEIAWVKIEAGGNDNNDFYVLTIIQLEEMKQEVTSSDILTALNTNGSIALYINFETGKSDIKPESQNIIDQVAGMLKENSGLKINIEGHTDNVGTAAANKALSENRAKSVMNALVAKGIDRSRLSSKGWGQEKPIADNSTDDGKAKNRRVEIVKL